MKSKYSPAEEAAYYRNRCAHQAMEIERLKSEKGFERIKEQCEKEAQEKNKELAAELRQKTSEANRLRKALDLVNARLELLGCSVRELTEKLASVSAKLQTFQETHRKDISAIAALNKMIENLSVKNNRAEEEHKEEIQKAQDQIAELNLIVQGKDKEIEELSRKVTALGGEAAKLEHQLRLDSTTSSKPSSAAHYHPPVANSRNPSGKSQGAQPGHPHHARRLLGIPGKVTCTICGEDDPLWSDPDYCFERYELKHVVKPVVMVVDQYVFVPVFRNRSTGAHKNAACPNWAYDEFNYGQEAKAMMLYLTLINRNAVRKCGDVMRDFSNGVLNPSSGFISGLSHEFARKSEPERAQAFQNLIDAKVMNVDGTTISVGGVYYNVTICVSGAITAYYFRPYKGDKGVKGTPIETTAAILVSDHDVTYYNYGMGHQECLQHIERYLKDSIAVEPEYKWNVRMLELIQKLIHEAKEVDMKKASKESCEGPEDMRVVFEGTEDGPHPRFSQTMIDSYRHEFDEILQQGLDEYNATPNKKWYAKGINLCKRMADNPDDYLLFMEDDRVPYTNNDAERAAREIKRKQAAAMTFRGFLGVVAYCESMSVIQVIRRQGMPILETMAQIFSRQATIQDSRRFKSVCGDVLLDVIQKDEDMIKELSEKSIPERIKQLSEAKQVVSELFKEHERILLKQNVESEPGSEQTEEDAYLLVKLNRAEREVYNLEQDIRVLNNRLAKRKRHLEAARKQQDEIKKSPCMQEDKAACNKPKETNQEPRKDDVDRTYSVDPGALSQAAARETEAKQKLSDAMERLSKATESYYNILYPAMDFKAGSRQSVFLGGKKSDRSSLPEAIKAKETLDKANEDVMAATLELSTITKNVDALRKGRKPGRRARRKSLENPGETLGKTG